mmetsp:Transcript_19602/g.22705  ORF Transcript_19602/g.22705 Transcript_19602/m.22705 type:complete len:504 (+) Transcript_19602:199-1710(+)
MSLAMSSNNNIHSPNFTYSCNPGLGDRLLNSQSRHLFTISTSTFISTSPSVPRTHTKIVTAKTASPSTNDNGSCTKFNIGVIIFAVILNYYLINPECRLSGENNHNSSPFSSSSLPISPWQHPPLHPSAPTPFPVPTATPNFDYDMSQSTEHNYKSQNMTFYGQYASIRSTLDYTYHYNYVPSRQLLQDEILNYLLYHHNSITHLNASTASPSSSSSSTSTCIINKNPWIVFTAGAMGAGKSYTIRHLHHKKRFPLSNFIIVDPDEIRRLLPEFNLYISNTSLAEHAGTLTKKEAGYIAEILLYIALQNGKNVLMDGSLKDWSWYNAHFDSLKEEFKTIGLQIAILHIIAPREAVFEKARIRSKMTKRIVPRHALEESFEQVPKSVKILSSKADFFAELYNSPHADDIELITEGMGWDAFKNVWSDDLIYSSSSASPPSFLSSSLLATSISTSSNILPFTDDSNDTSDTDARNISDYRNEMPSSSFIHSAGEDYHITRLLSQL